MVAQDNRLEQTGDAGSAKGNTVNTRGEQTAGGEKIVAQGTGAPAAEDLSPFQRELLAQVQADASKDKNHGHKKFFATESNNIAKLTENEQKSVTDLVNAIKARGSASGADGGQSNAADAAALEHFVSNPARLKVIKDMVHLELERQNLGKRYQLSIEPYLDADRKKAAALVVTDTKMGDKPGAIFGYGTDGKPVPESMLTLFFD